MISTKYYSFEEIIAAGNAIDDGGHAAAQLMMMYRKAVEVAKPTILELGTAKGHSTTAFLQACDEADGRLISIDISDCSDISDSSRWQFVQSDSTDVEYILSQSPHLREGIDILYIDSLHRISHVEKEITGWYPYLNQGSHIFLDDVVSHPYRRGNAKDYVRAEILWDEMREYIEAFFHSNENQLHLELLFGSTGLAHLHKLSSKGTQPEPARRILHRRKNIVNVLKYTLSDLFASFKRKVMANKTQSSQKR